MATAGKKTEEPVKEKKESKPTERVVLLCSAVAAGQLQVTEAQKKLLTEDGDGNVEVYVVVGRATGTKDQVVDKLAADVAGAYRAPNLRGWKDGVNQAPPPPDQSLVKSTFE